MFQRILVATDGTALCDKAVNNAIALSAFNGADLVALTVVPRCAATYLDAAMAFASDEIECIERESADVARQALDALAQKARLSGVQLQTITFVSDAVADAIVAEAQRQHCDLIIMGSHGRNGFAQLLMGSETQHVLSHSKLPVLVVR